MFVLVINKLRNLFKYVFPAVVVTGSGYFVFHTWWNVDIQISNQYDNVHWRKENCLSLKRKLIVIIILFPTHLVCWSTKNTDRKPKMDKNKWVLMWRSLSSKLWHHFTLISWEKCLLFLQVDQFGDKSTVLKKLLKLKVFPSTDALFCVTLWVSVQTILTVKDTISIKLIWTEQSLSLLVFYRT